MNRSNSNVKKRGEPNKPSQYRCHDFRCCFRCTVVAGPAAAVCCGRPAARGHSRAAGVGGHRPHAQTRH